MASFTGVGEYKQLSDAVKNMSHITYEYVPNKENHEIYRKLYDRVYRKLYDANKNSTKKSAKSSNIKSGNMHISA